MKYFIYIVAIMLLFGCRTKQKAIERGKEKTTTLHQAEVKEVTSSKITTDSLAKLSTETIKLTGTSEIDLQQADENKTITITDASGRTMVIKGANAKIKETTTAETATTDQTVIKNQTTETNKVKDSTGNTKTETKTKFRNVVTHIKSVGNWWWLIVIFVIFLVYWHYFKRT